MTSLGNEMVLGFGGNFRILKKRNFLDILRKEVS